MLNKEMGISIVIPLFNEGDNIVPLFKEIKEVMAGITEDYEIVFIDDGSSDDSFTTLKRIHTENAHVKVVRFRKNFGQTSALLAGFFVSSGTIVITMDGDLQNDPHDIPRLLEKIVEYDVVSGWRRQRKDPFISKKLPSLFSNWLARRLTGVNVHDFGCTLKAYRKEVTQGLELYGEMHRYIPALVAWRGFRVTEIEVNHRPRLNGKSKYNIWRLLKGLLDLMNVKFLMSYSSRPIHIFGGIGIVTFLVGSILGIWLSFERLFLDVGLSNRPLILLAILLVMLGIQFLMLGFLAELVNRALIKREENVYNIQETLK